MRGRADGAGALVGSASYDAFGTARAASGASGTFGWAGEQADPETGQVHLRARQYAPGLGRFLSVDPEFPSGPGTQGYQPYAYAGNNPATWTVPSGESVLGLLGLLAWLLGLSGADPADPCAELDLAEGTPCVRALPNTGASAPALEELGGGSGGGGGGLRLPLPSPGQVIGGLVELGKVLATLAAAETVGRIAESTTTTTAPEQPPRDYNLRWVLRCGDANKADLIKGTSASRRPIPGEGAISVQFKPGATPTELALGAACPNANVSLTILDHLQSDSTRLGYFPIISAKPTPGRGLNHHDLYVPRPCPTTSPS